VSEGAAGEDGKDVFGNVIPGLPGNDPEIKLFNGLELHGSAIKAAQDGLLLFQASGKSFFGEVINYQDAKIGIHISEDAMEVKGDFFREAGPGVPISVENLKKVIASYGIKKGIDWMDLEKACAHT
ncbi:flagellar assembly protein A, partial [Treponema sp. R6D11]